MSKIYNGIVYTPVYIYIYIYIYIYNLHSRITSYQYHYLENIFAEPAFNTHTSAINVHL